MFFHASFPCHLVEPFAWTPFLLALMLCGILVALAPHVPRFAGRVTDLKSVQAAHVKLTPRVGGIGLFAALLYSTAFVPQNLTDQYAKFLLATALLFGVGLAEDLGWHVPPKGRLLAAGIASLGVVVLLDAWAPRIGWPLLDASMASGLLGIPITIFAVAGISNAFNLIDGVNGLSGSTALVSAIALSSIASAAGYEEMAILAALFALGLAGFLTLNFPFGWIFLGDAGAYTAGFVLAWFGVALMITQTEVAPWAILLTMFWPIADTLLAIYRRGIGKRPAMQPDRLHVHQLVMRGLEINLLGRNRRHIANPLTTVVIAPFMIAPALVGVVLWDQNLPAFLAFWGLLVIFFGTYFFAMKLVKSGWFKRFPSNHS